jgi:hypothetical protein
MGGAPRRRPASGGGYLTSGQRDCDSGWKASAAGIVAFTL